MTTGTDMSPLSHPPLALSDAAVEAHRHLAWGPGGSDNSASDQTRLLLKAGDHGRAGDAAARARQMVGQALNEPTATGAHPDQTLGQGDQQQARTVV